MTLLSSSQALAHNDHQVELLLFASAAELAKSRHLIVQVPDRCRIDEFVQIVGERYPALTSLAVISRWAIAEQFVPSDFVILENLTIAMIPPVSGG